MKTAGDDEQIVVLVLGVRGIETLRLWPPGVDGASVLRWTRMVELDVALALALGVPNGAGSLGPLGAGVVARSMVEVFSVGGEGVGMVRVRSQRASKIYT